MNDEQLIEDILAFWFGELDSAGMCSDTRNKLWFQSNAEGDEQIRGRFGGLVEAAIEGALGHWQDTARGTIALVILLDQFTRNIYRDSPAAFSGDAKALQLARDAVARGDDSGMPAIHRVFLYIPYEHSENLEDQDAGIDCFDRLLEESSRSAEAEITDFRRYMVAHRDVIAQFGRFPHRNAILGRESTSAELEHLKHHGGF